MEAAVWGFVGVVIGGIITGFVSIRLETIRADREASLDSAKRADDRRLGRDAFQREGLLALQDAVGEVNSSLVKYRTRQAGYVPEADLPVRYQASTFRVITLRSRVADKEIREAAAGFIAAAGRITGAHTEADADVALGEAGTFAHRVIERSGELIHATFVEPTPKS